MLIHLSDSASFLLMIICSLIFKTAQKTSNALTNANQNLSFNSPPIFAVTEHSPIGTKIGSVFENPATTAWIAAEVGKFGSKMVRLIGSQLNSNARQSLLQGQILSFSMSSNYFTINSSTGSISTVKVIDREALLLGRYFADANDRLHRESSKATNSYCEKNSKQMNTQLCDCYIESNLNLFIKTLEKSNITGIHEIQMIPKTVRFFIEGIYLELISAKRNNIFDIS